MEHAQFNCHSIQNHSPRLLFFFHSSFLIKKGDIGAKVSEDDDGKSMHVVMVESDQGIDVPQI